MDRIYELYVVSVNQPLTFKHVRYQQRQTERKNYKELEYDA
jgi:hypothetical protein